MNDIVESNALNALSHVEHLAETLGRAETLLEKGYAEFAEALLVVQENRYWQGDHESWGEYMRFVTEKYNMGTRQVYHKLAAVKELKDDVSIGDLTEMGITKASVLADIHRNGGKLPEGAVELAKDPATTAKQLKQAMAEALHLSSPELGQWYDMGFSFVCTEEEKAELQDAEKAARRMDPPISNTLKDFEQKKQVALRFAREFLATYPSEEESA